MKATSSFAPTPIRICWRSSTRATKGRLPSSAAPCRLGTGNSRITTSTLMPRCALRRSTSSPPSRCRADASRCRCGLRRKKRPRSWSGSARTALRISRIVDASLHAGRRTCPSCRKSKCPLEFRQPHRRQLAQSVSDCAPCRRGLARACSRRGTGGCGGRRGRTRERGADGLLGAIWRVFAAEKTDPRRLHTADLIGKLMEPGRRPLADGEQRQADRRLLSAHEAEGLRNRKGKWRRREARPAHGGPGFRQAMKRGYSELHFADAFLRYLGKGLPSKAPHRKARKTRSARRKTSPLKPSSYPIYPLFIRTSAASGVSSDNAEAYTAADRAA